MTSFERRPRLAVAMALALAGALFVPRGAEAQSAERAVADVAQARELFVQAKEQRDSGDVKGALEKFKAAHALAQTPLTGLELGRTYRMASMLLEAREELLKVAQLPVTAAETSRSADARREAAELAEQLQGRIPSVSIVVSGMPGEQVVVTIDGDVVPSAALLAPRLVNPGPHTILARAGTAHDEARLELREGESKKVELKTTPQDVAPVRGPVAPPPAPEPAAPPPRRSHSAGYVLDAVGGAGLVVGAVLVARSVLYAKQGNDETEKAATSLNPTDVHTLQSASAGDTSAGSVNRIGGIVGLVAGAGALGAGLYLSTDHRPKAPTEGRLRRAPIAAVQLAPVLPRRGGGAGINLVF